ncbi:MAG: Maf family protein [Planctomycetota bacterium]
MTPSLPHLILVSRSPGRRALLHAHGLAHRAEPSPYQDPADPAEHLQNQGEIANSLARAADLAGALARNKARAWIDAADAPPSAPSVALSADTVCVDHRGRLIGTPETPHQARNMLANLSGQTHHVVSAAWLVSNGLPGIDTGSDWGWGWTPEVDAPVWDAAEVRLGPIDPGDLDAYLDSQAWRGRAGGYDLQDRLDAGWQIDVAGDPAAVTGLPWRKLAPHLVRLGFHPAANHDATPSNPARSHSGAPRAQAVGRSPA